MNHAFRFLGACCLALFVTVAAEAKSRSIRRVESINVEAPVGTVPRLPWQVWVTYSDGHQEWRQTRWNNALRSIEEEQANAELHPVGSFYTVEGFITGDNTTLSGYPITAHVRVVEAADPVPAPQPKAHPLPLGDVRLTGNNRLTSNRDLDIRTILSWDVNQQLYNYRDTYGLSTDGYPEADGWDSPTTKLKGHGSGHYMSALAFAFASATDKDQRDELRRRIRRMVDELRLCQERTFVWDASLGRYWEARDLAPEEELRYMKGTWTACDEFKKDWRHYGYGYLNAIPAQHACLVEMYRPYNNEDWVWAPYYSIHKQLAGLIDIALNIDDKEIADKALLIAKDMGLWVWNRLHYRTFVQTEGSREERRQRPGNRYEMWNMYIAGEVGGMAESLSRLSEMVVDRDESDRLLEAASYFDAPAFFDPLSRNIDDIRTRHANQHIPMITGALRSYRGNGNPYYYRLAFNFWNLVQGRYAYAMGGVGNGEMFRQPYCQTLSMNTNVMSDHNRDIYPNPDINETCCAYNLAKLTKDLNGYDPDNAALMDYYERLLSNQLVGSLHPEHYAVTYQYAVGMNAQKPFGNETPQSTCCGGTGAENHVKYQEAAYFVSDNTLWVALYLPTHALWREKGVTIQQECSWPAEETLIRIKGEAEFTMRLRVPYWATEGFEVRLNGRSLTARLAPAPSSYFEIPNRHWSEGDVVEVHMPFAKHVHFSPDKMDIAATGRNETSTAFPPQWVGTLMLGPLVMATPDIRSWQEADMNLSPDLREVKVSRQSSVIDCYVGGVSFQPDYSQTGRSTHYLRLNTQGVGAKTADANRKKADLTALSQALQVARERQGEREAWAPHGYARLVQQIELAQAMLARSSRSVRQADADAALSALNMAINTMRPSNLAEPEDLAELLTLLAQTKNLPQKTAPQREAIRYGEMVVQYVNDGSGTPDLIRKATQQLREAK